jgi:hypothetical protein
VLLGGLAIKHPLISFATVALSFYFCVVGIACGFVNTPIAQRVKTSSFSWIYDSGKWIYELFEQHHGVHEILLGLGGIAIGSHH